MRGWAPRLLVSDLRALFGLAMADSVSVARASVLLDPSCSSAAGERVIAALSLADPKPSFKELTGVHEALKGVDAAAAEAAFKIGAELFPLADYFKPATKN